MTICPSGGYGPYTAGSTGPKMEAVLAPAATATCSGPPSLTTTSREAFINAAAYDTKVLLWQTLIHVAFLLSAMAIAATDRLLPQPAHGNTHR